MRNALLAVFAALFMTPQLPQIAAAETMTLGYGRFFNNDALGDGKDRWRSGSYAISMIRGQGWDGALPQDIGAFLEYRLRSEVIAPEDLARPAAMDRRYVGAISAGLHTHFARAGAELRLGADLVATGPQTGVGGLQRDLHKLFGMTPPGDLSNQIPNHVYPTLSAEMARPYRFGTTHIRPYLEAQAGVETYLRLGGDLVFGSFGQGAMMLRDAVTGQRFVAVRGADVPGVSFTLGGDIARVFDSAYLPDGGAAVLRETRVRMRMGMNWRGKKSEVFYGLTYLGREYEGQPSGQTLGSLRLHIRF